MQSRRLDNDIDLPIDGSYEIILNTGNSQASNAGTDSTSSIDIQNWFNSLSDTSTAQETFQGFSDEAKGSDLQSTIINNNGISAGAASISTSRSSVPAHTEDHASSVDCPPFGSDDYLTHSGTQFEDGAYEVSLVIGLDDFESACDEVLRQCAGIGPVVAPNESENDASFSVGVPLNFGQRGYNRSPDDN